MFIIESVPCMFSKGKESFECTWLSGKVGSLVCSNFTRKQTKQFPDQKLASTKTEHCRNMEIRKNHSKDHQIIRDPSIPIIRNGSCLFFNVQVKNYKLIFEHVTVWFHGWTRLDVQADVSFFQRKRQSGKANSRVVGFFINNTEETVT